MFFRLCVHVKEHAKHMTSIRGFSELSLLIFVLYFIHLNRALRLLKIFKRSAEKMLTLFFLLFVANFPHLSNAAQINWEIFHLFLVDWTFYYFFCVL